MKIPNSKLLAFTLEGSPCINAGIDSLEINGATYYSPEFDIDGDERPFNLMADIGADERYPNTGIVDLCNSSDDLIIQIFPNPFTNYVTIYFELKSAAILILAFSIWLVKNRNSFQWEFTVRNS